MNKSKLFIIISAILAVIIIIIIANSPSPQSIPNLPKNTWDLLSELKISNKRLADLLYNNTSWVLINESWLNKNNVFGQYELNIIKNFSITGDKSLSNYPLLKINKKVQKIQLVIDTTFTDSFTQKYDYEFSNWYFFALKFFLWDFDNGWYYSVFRKDSWGVWNSSNDGLIWAKTASEVNNWTTRYIDITNRVPIANNKESYWFTYINALWYINNNIWNEIRIWAYLSSTKEVDGRNLTKIKSMKIIYEWEKDAITLIP